MNVNMQEKLDKQWLYATCDAPPAEWYRSGCRERCPYGGRCTLSCTHKHELHVCANEKCMCHSERRYREEM